MEKNVSSFLIGFIIGLFIGAIVGICTLCIIQINRDEKEE